ncbi:MAG: hypothetical protein K6E40_06125 [Desulfovibrio sp.]|nr:hypothetical protein [Desulfovibrio sp.]
MSGSSFLSPLAETPAWLSFRGLRARQRKAGLLACCLLVVGLAVLVDGLVSQMRGGGSFRIEMLAGTAEPVSGPQASLTATEKDMEAFPIPADAPLNFEFDGFFSSYWFGTGMWRGRIRAFEYAESGIYGMAVGIRGTPSAAHQTYTVVVARSEEELNAMSLSFVRRFTGWNPFYVAMALVAAGLAASVLAFLLGRRCDGLTRSLGLAEIFRTQDEGDFLRVFMVTGLRKAEGKNFVAWDANLGRLGKVLNDGTRAGVTECLFVKDAGRLPRKGDFVAVWDPVALAGQPEDPGQGQGQGEGQGQGQGEGQNQEQA